MISAVFDSTALLQAATNRKGPAGACLTFVDEGRVKLFISAALLEEVRDVLSRPDFRKAFPTLTDENVQNFLEHLVDKGHTVEDIPAAYRLNRDPDDEPFVNLAIASQAAFLVSRDKHLLDVMNDVAFRKAYPALTILDPVAFLKHVRAQVAKELGYE
jgi:putative PIN family toxin of toxin-antitoxin system